jgi:hypothetical protein
MTIDQLSNPAKSNRPSDRSGDALAMNAAGPPKQALNGLMLTAVIGWRGDWRGDRLPTAAQNPPAANRQRIREHSILIAREAEGAV